MIDNPIQFIINEVLKCVHIYIHLIYLYTKMINKQRYNILIFLMYLFFKLVYIKLSQKDITIRAVGKPVTMQGV